MAKPTKRKVPGSDVSVSNRVTPKGSDGAAAKVSSRVTPKGTRPQGEAYEAPSARHIKPSAPWVPILMFALLAIGIAVIILNYVEVMPGSPTNTWLLIGLGAILGGIITATQFR